MKYIKVPIFLPAENCYILYDENTNEAVIIDPGNEPKKIIDAIVKKNLKPIYILLTHGHADHIAGISKLKEEFQNLKVFVHENDAQMLKNSDENLSRLILGREVEISADVLLKDKDCVEFSKNKIKVIHTPGHSSGGVCYLADNFLFCGDTIFKLGIGRWDFCGGDYKSLINSIQNKIFTLDKNTLLLPGHGPESSIEYEMEYNPYLK